MTQSSLPVHILIIEDDLPTSEFLADLLNWGGYTTVIAASGDAAVATLAATMVQIILLDRRLPDTDGVELCRDLRASVGATVPIIMLTADHSPLLDKAAYNAGVTEYIAKPVDIDYLLSRIAALSLQ